MSWKKIVLGDYIKTLTDYHANGAYKKLKENVTLKYEPNFALMIRTLNFEQNNFENNLIWIDETEYEFLAKTKVYDDDLIMNKIANAGSVYIMPNLNRPVSLAMNLFLIRFEGLHQRFMYYIMKNNETYIKSFANGVATQSITKEAVRNLVFEIPDYNHQKRIASILSTYDDLIENNLKRIKLLEETAQNIYKEWFVNFRFPNYEHTEFDAESGLPVGWEKNKLEEVAKLIHGYAFDAKRFTEEPTTVMVLRMGNFKEKGGIQLDKNVKYISKEYDFNEKFKLFAGDLIIVLSDVTRDGRIIGNVGILPDYGIEYALNQRVAKLECENKIKTYLYCALNSFDFKEHCKPRANGATVLNLKSIDVNEYKIILPPESIIESFSAIINPLLKIMENLDLQNQKLKEARDILLPRLMNRTIEV